MFGGRGIKGVRVDFEATLEVIRDGCRTGFWDGRNVWRQRY